MGRNVLLPPQQHERGMSIIELVSAVAVIGISMMVILQQITLNHRQESRNRDTGFAYVKAMALLSEVQVSVDQGDIADPGALDALANTTPDPLLTTRTGGTTLPPDHPMSGNTTLRNGGWKWGRTIDVESVPHLDRTRYVRIKIHRRDGQGTYHVEASAGALLSIPTTAHPSVKEYDVYLIAIAGAPSLWMDVPTLRSTMQSAAERIEADNPSLKFRLHWITKLGYGRDPYYTPYVNESATAAAATPWVYCYPGRLASGDAVSRLYSADMFTGRIKTEAGIRNDYDAKTNPHPHSVADRFNHCMREPEARALFDARVAAGLDKEDEPPLQLLLDDLYSDTGKLANAMIINLHGSALPFPPLRNYSDAAKVPDRLPGVRVVTHPTRLHVPRDFATDTLEALASTIEGHVAATSGGDDDDDDRPSYYNDLVDAGKEAREAVKKHGEGKPKDAINELKQCIEKLDKAVLDGFSSSSASALVTRGLSLMSRLSRGTYGQGADALELRVYAYKTDPDEGDDTLTEPITIQIMGVDLTSCVNAMGATQTLEIRRQLGGIASASYVGFDETGGIPPLWSASCTEMSFTCGYSTSPQPHTWIRVYNTPLACPPVGGEGLHPDARLYGMDYIPSPVAYSDRHYELDNLTGQMAPKNTARWRIRIPSQALAAQLGTTDTRLTIKTRIGSDMTTGRTWPTANEPYNCSTTYAWWTDSKNAIPLSERYQFQGDPRHLPYLDLMREGTSFPHGYNACFDDLRATVSAVNHDWSNSWSCFDRTKLSDGFGDGNVFDVARGMQVWRQALQASNAVFSHGHGFVASALVQGGEIALPFSGTALSASRATLHGSLYGSAGAVSVDDIGIGTSGSKRPSPTDRSGRPVIVSGSTDFWSKEWLGELYPDSHYASYVADGNLGTSSFHRMPRWKASLANLPYATRFLSGSTLAGLGYSSLLHHGSASALPAQTASATGQTIRLNPGANDILSSAGFTSTSAITSRMPLTTNAGLSLPAHLADIDLFPRQESLTLSVLGVVPSVAEATTVLQIAPSNQKSASAFFAINTEAPTDPTAQRDLATRTLLYGLRTLHEGGVSAWAHTIPPVPRIEILSPTPEESFQNPTAIELNWQIDWTRFDGRSYTDRHPNNFAGDEADLRYIVLISNNDGATWRYATDGQTANLEDLGDHPAHILTDSTPGPESYSMLTPASLLPTGKAIVRVVCLHSKRETNLSHHMVEISVQR